MTESFSKDQKQKLIERPVAKNIKETYAQESIESLRDPIWDIVQTINKDISAGRYSLIIGDDASGRIPALIMGGIIERVNKQKNYPAPSIFFVAGSGQYTDYDERLQKEEKIDQFVGSLMPPYPLTVDTKEKILVVTDVIATGNSLKPLTVSLRNRGVTFDVAAMHVRNDHIKKNLETEWHTRIVNSHSGSIYGKHEIGGVKKKLKDLFSRPIKEKTENILEKKDAQQLINFARQESAWVANELSEKFLKEFDSVEA